MSKNSISFNSLGSSGQVGNQLFQFAALINLANINNLKVLIPDPNTVEGEYFYDYFTVDKIHQKVEFGISKYRELIDSNFEFIKFDKRLLNIEGDANLNGYFQSLKYINLDEKKIKELYKFKNDYIEASRKIINDLGFDEFFFLHVRRGDYIEKKEYHYPLSKQYYKKAFKKFKDNSKFIIFSDDLKWCKKQKIFQKDNVTYIDKEVDIFSKSLNPDIIELCIMSMCNGGIIANSSFSWWGAWLQDKSSLVVMPHENIWFGRKYKFNAHELIKDSWITVGDSRFYNLKYKIFG